MKVVGNLKELIAQAANAYISLNASLFKSTTPGPKGDDGDIGPQGVGVHHLKGTSTTQDEGDFAYPGETDTYTFYPDANESYPLGWFNVRNGYDAFQYAVTAGYAGTEADFYLELANVRDYFEQSEENAASTSADALQTAADRVAVAADRVIVVDAKAIAVSAKDAAVTSSSTVQQIFLGTKASDPTVDNQGNPLVIGVMYYNSTSGTLRIWNGSVWNLGAFSASGAVVTVNGRDGAVVLTKSDVGLGNVDNESKSIMFTNPVFTGIQTGTTASVGTNSTRLATTAFVVSEINKIEEW